MIKSSDALTIAQIFTNDKSIYYDIPKYQREYTWGVKEWDALFDDIVSNEEGYFLGSIICVNVSASSFSDVHLQVIDGQQRITTLSLLLLSIYSKLLEFLPELTENQSDKLKSIKKELVITKDQNDKEVKVPRLSPQTQGNNRDDYLSILCDHKLLDGFSKVKNTGNRRIYKAYKFFNEEIDKFIEEEIEADKTIKPIQILFRLLSKVNNSILVSIEVEQIRTLICCSNLLTIEGFR